MSWNELPTDDLSKLSFPSKAGKVGIRRTPGQPKIVVEQQVPPGEKVIYLRVNDDLHKRMARNVAGPVRSAIIAILEEAMDELEAGEEQWSVVDKASIGQGT